MEDWIGIIFAVGYIVFSVWNSTKKKEEEVPLPTTQADWEEENPDQEVVWEEEMQEIPSPAQMVEPAPQQKAHSLNDLITSLGHAPRAEKVKQTVIKATKEKKPALEKRAGNPIGCRLHSTQEARRAFIYSEIFKRKYN